MRFSTLARRRATGERASRAREEGGDKKRADGAVTDLEP